MSTALVIFNPNAGRGRGQKRVQEVQGALDAAGLPYESVISEDRGHAIELAHRASLAGRELIVAAGGDGTINEAVNGLMKAAAEGAAMARLGIMPIGSGNDFAGSLGIPLELRQAADKLVRGELRRVDIGLVNGRYFDNNVGVGFEALINIEAHKMTWLRGQPLYLVAVFRAMASFPFPTVTIDLDGRQIKDKSILMISVGNNPRIGGGFPITPDAVPDDGEMDICIVDAIARLKILQLLPKAMKGTHRDEPEVELTRFTHLVIESETPLPVHADGEILWNDAHRVDVQVLPGRLQVVV